MSLPSPYYSHGGITIYHGDCRVILPALGKSDLLLTDPPYGINADRDRNCRVNGWVDYGSSGWDKERPDRETLQASRGAARHAIIWGGNYFTDYLPASMGWLSWDKGQRDFSLADFELAWTSFQSACRVFEYARGKALAADLREHPTQKPVELMRFCIQHADKRASRRIESVVDSFMGSGTTLRAAKDLERKAIGIEIEEKYCEIAARRLEQEVLHLATH